MITWVNTSGSILPPDNTAHTGPCGASSGADVISAATAAAPAGSTMSFARSMHTNSARQSVFADRANRVGESPYMSKRDRPGQCNGDAVGHRRHRLGANGLAGGQRARPGRRGGGLHPDHPHLRRQKVRRSGDSGDQPATAGGHHNGGDIPNLLQDLQPDGGLPGDDVGVIERVDQHRAVLLRIFTRRDQRVVDRLADQVNSCAIRLGGHQLRQRDIDRHEHRRRDPQLGGGPRHALRMVAGAGRDHPASPVLDAQIGDPVVGAARLERPSALQVLALEPHLFARAIRQHPRRDDRG